MKKIVAVGLIISAFLAGSTYAIDAVGTTFGAMTTAPAIGQGSGHFGVGLGLGNNYTSFVGTFRYGLSKYSDGAIKLGLADPDGGSDTKFVIGADFKYQFWQFGPQPSDPFDFSVGGFFEYGDFDYVSIWHLGGFLLASYPIAVGQTRQSTISPYGRFNIRMESVDPANNNADSQTNLKLGLNAGIKWDVAPTVSFFGEFQVDGNDGAFFGVDFGVM